MMAHDKDPAHFCAPVHDCLGMVFSSHWIACGSMVLLPPRSPDQTSLHFFFLMELFQGFGASRGSDNRNGLCCSSSFWWKLSCTATCELIHTMAP
ncbi:UNVERIFIED_CONTAM: hypothetical protein NCL1_07580 [Trichonephila clavipes]